MNCRSCGRPLTDMLDLHDGICSDIRVSDESCANRLFLWAVEHRPDSTHEPLASPKWSVTVDEWLAATR